jgi:hypothetical protein
MNGELPPNPQILHKSSTNPPQLAPLSPLKSAPNRPLRPLSRHQHAKTQRKQGIFSADYEKLKAGCGQGASHGQCGE